MLNIILILLLMLASYGSAQAFTFHLHWTDNSDNEEGFFLYRDGAKIGQVGANVVDYNDNVPDTPGVTYSYECSAFNHARNPDGSEGAIQESAKSNSATGLVPYPPNPAPNAPSGLTTEPITTSDIFLQWKDNADNENGQRVTVNTEKPPRSEYVMLAANMTEAIVTGLKKNTKSCFTVAAFNENGYSAESNQSCATTPKKE